MQRRIVKHGSSTLTISLPSKWVKKTGVKPGDALEVSEKGTQLVIGTTEKAGETEIKLDLSGTKKMLKRIISAIYKSGFDKVAISYRNPEELEMIQDAIYRFCHVYEIINIKKNKVEIKAISTLDPRNFDQMLRKSTQATMNVARETLEAIRKQDYQELSNLILKDKIIDRYAAFGSRIINQEYDIEGSNGPLYLIIDETEIAADIFKVISRDMVDYRRKLSRRLLDLFEDIITLMEKLYDILFDFSIQKIRELGELEQYIRKKIDEACNNEKDNIKILAYLINLFETSFEMKSAVMVYHFRKIC